MEKRKLAALLLAAALPAALAACAHSEPEEPAGADWRTWGTVSDAGTITQNGEATDVLVCVFREQAAFYYDDATQTLFAEAAYPQAMDDAREAYQSVSFDDRNADGSSDVQLTFLHDDGTQTTLVWYWEDGTGFVLQPDADG